MNLFAFSKSSLHFLYHPALLGGTIYWRIYADCYFLRRIIKLANIVATITANNNISPIRA